MFTNPSPTNGATDALDLRRNTYEERVDRIPDTADWDDLCSSTPEPLASAIDERAANELTVLDVGIADRIAHELTHDPAASENSQTRDVGREPLPGAWIEPEPTDAADPDPQVVDEAILPAGATAAQTAATQRAPKDAAATSAPWVHRTGVYLDPPGLQHWLAYLRDDRTGTSPVGHEVPVPGVPALRAAMPPPHARGAAPVLTRSVASTTPERGMRGAAYAADRSDPWASQRIARAPTYRIVRMTAPSRPGSYPGHTWLRPSERFMLLGAAVALGIGLWVAWFLPELPGALTSPRAIAVAAPDSSRQPDPRQRLPARGLDTRQPAPHLDAAARSPPPTPIDKPVLAPLRHAPALARPAASLLLTSTPSGAVVTINGNRLGQTPITIERTSQLGPSSLQVSLSGHEPFVADLRSLTVASLAVCLHPYQDMNPEDPAR
jgi:hypothetical protein